MIETLRPLGVVQVYRSIIWLLSELATSVECQTNGVIRDWLFVASEKRMPRFQSRTSHHSPITIHALSRAARIAASRAPSMRGRISAGVFACLRDLAGVDRRRPRAAPPRVARARRRRVGSPTSAASTQVGEPLRPAPGIRRIEQLQQLRGIELLRVHDQVRMARGEQSEVPARRRQLEPLRERLHGERVATRARAPRCAPPAWRPRRAARSSRRMDSAAAAGLLGRASRSPGGRAGARRISCSTSNMREGCRFHEPAGKLLPHALGTSASASPFSAILRMSSSVSGAMANAKRAAKRATRRMRTGSSANAGLTWRSTPAFEIARAVERIDDAALLVLRHRVDRQVAALEVLLERHVGSGVELEAVIAARGLALGARERVFLFRLRVQEHREVPADGLVAELHHLLGRRADHDVVAVLHRQPEQLVAHGAADGVDLHEARDSDRASDMAVIGLYITQPLSIRLIRCHELGLRRAPRRSTRPPPAARARHRRSGARRLAAAAA